jgi:hypothetical protein
MNSSINPSKTMKTFVSILAFIISWMMITFVSAFAITLVFNQNYMDVVTFPVFVVISILGFTIIAANVASEVYDHLESQQA